MSAGALGAACSSSSSNQVLPGEVDASTGVDSGGPGPGVDSGEQGTDSGSQSMDAGVDCGKLPTLHAPGAGPYCPFQEGGTGDAATLFFGDCPATDTCCDYQGPNGGPPATCAANAGACPAPDAGYILIPFGCDTKSQCPANSVCCMFGKDGGTTNVTTNPTCSTGVLLKAQNVGGTKCEQATQCAAGEIKLCADDTECVAPLKCTAFPTNAQQLGLCK